MASSVLLLSLFASSGWAQAPAVTHRNQLPALARSLQTSYTPVGSADVEAARERLHVAMATLERSLDASGPANAARWREYLAWDKLGMQSLPVEGPDAAEMQDIVKRFTGKASGLERREFVAVRERLQDLRRIAVIAAEPELEKAVAFQIEQLAEALEAYDATPSGEAAAEIGRLVSWLQRHQQVRPLITGIQRHFLQPNLELQFSEGLLGSMQENRHIDRVQPINDVVLGTHVCGSARLIGDTTLDLVRCQKHALGNALVQGMIFTQTVGTQRKVTVCSHGCGSVCAVKPIIFTPGNVYGLPATASADTHTTIDDIQARRRFVERIAWKRAGKQLPQAEAIANAKTAARLQENVDEESVEMLANMNRDLNNSLRYPIIRRGVAPYWEHYSSSDTHLLVHWLAMNSGQIGAAIKPPPLQRQYDIDIRFHESAAANIGEQILGGVKLTSERMAEIRAENKLPPPRRSLKEAEDVQEAEEEDEETPWSITFTWERPVQVRFTADGFLIIVRATELTRIDNDKPESITGDIQITASYKIEVTPTGAILRREGKVESRIQNSRLAPRNIATYNAFLRKRFASVFPEEIEGNGVVPKGRLGRVGTIFTRFAQTSGEWMTLGLEVVPHTAPSIPVVGR
jgi:hypothetical protein